MWEWTARKRGWDEGRVVFKERGNLEGLEVEEWEEVVKGIVDWAEEAQRSRKEEKSNVRNFKREP